RAGRDSVRAQARIERAARARVERRAVWAVRRRAGALDLGANLGAGAEARIEQALRRESVERRAIVIEMLGLAPDRHRPVEAEPGEIVEQRRLEGRTRAAEVDVLDAQQEAAALVFRGVPSEERGISVTEMEMAGRAGREAGDDHGVGASAGAGR